MAKMDVYSRKYVPFAVKKSLLFIPLNFSESIAKLVSLQIIRLWESSAGIDLITSSTVWRFELAAVAQPGTNLFGVKIYEPP